MEELYKGINRRRDDRSPQPDPSKANKGAPAELAFLTAFPGDVKNLERTYRELKKLWLVFGAEFTEYWQRLAESDRRAFLLANVPYLSESVRIILNISQLCLHFGVEISQPEARMNQDKSHYSDYLLPDFNVDVLVHEMNFVTRIEKVVSHPASEAIWDDLRLARSVSMLQKQALLQDPRFGPKDFTFTTPKDFVTYKYKDPSPKDPEFVRLQDWIATGVVFEGNVWWSAAYRFMIVNGMTYLCLLAFKKDALLKNPSKDRVVNFCQACGKTDGPLRHCAVCKAAQYCSRPCQISDWPNHKIQCKATKK